MTCEERRDALFLLAAEELEAPERDEQRVHLASGCPRCLGVLAEAQAAVARFAAELPPVEPPESVRRALAARIALETRLPEQLLPLETPSARPGRADWRALAAAAGLAAILAGGVTALATRARVASVEHVASERDRALDVIGSRYMRAVEISGPALGFQGRGLLYWDYHSGGCFFRATQMQPPEAGKVYVLWFTDSDGAPLRAGVLEVSRRGEATLLTEMPRQIDTTGEVQVTVESNAAVSQPTAQPVLHGSLSF
jgi:anti-sigma-K factor RskA